MTLSDALLRDAKWWIDPDAVNRNMDEEDSLMDKYYLPYGVYINCDGIQDLTTWTHPETWSNFCLLIAEAIK